MANFKHTACSSPDCLLPHTARGFCQKHYDIFRRPRVGRFKQTDEDRFWVFVEKTETCWLWKSSCFSGTTRGQFKSRRLGKNFKAYRFSYELIKGKIPDGLTLDHLCRNPNCVNPDHLEAVTAKENVARIPREKICKRGHERIPGTRRCKICSSFARPGRQSEHRKMLYRLQTRRESGQHG